jgi:glycosyltransferase involved in cell wall biosynthesis
MDVAVLTSDSESLSNVILEAMAAALPVVAYDAGGNSELVSKERGALIRAGDEKAFADAVVCLLSGAAMRERLGRAGREFVQDNFRLEQVRSRYEELYQNLLARKGVKRARAVWSAREAL